LPLAIGAEPALPLAPVHLRAKRSPGSADVVLSWIRRSRGDANGWGVADATLDHAPEAYRVVIYDGVVVKRTIDVSAAGVTYAAAQQTADFGSPPAAFGFTVAQVSAMLGPGHVREGAFAA
jgi:hypothetical protein